MIKKIYYIYIFSFLLCSCDKLLVKKENQEEILKEKWSEIDTNQVDKPPMFTTCMNEPEEIDDCFHQTIIDHIKAEITETKISVTESINDTIWIPLLVDKRGNITLEDFKVPEIINTQIPDFEKILNKSISTLPKANPAIVRSTPVTSRYKLPVVIHMN
ncbi:hypothetical protein [Aquimarina litoralis]|uniref:hypothetical protein n=1 Tax=Aquimarina litoralis TaxID=584605 RepID=UPI001C5A1732|nr:hypothetical protein [Aquimarina litoralis]MBW1295984.1 hypothetical protein [Aquimarina litoralis]